MKIPYLKFFGIFFLLYLGSLSAFSQNVQSPKMGTEIRSDRTGLLIPNAFSPNGDGQNDFFEILNFTNQKLIDFKVFNRWGTVVFATEDPKKGWDGTYKNQAQPVGIYGYTIRILYPDGIVETYKGTVTLIR